MDEGLQDLPCFGCTDLPGSWVYITPSSFMGDLVHICRFASGLVGTHADLVSQALVK